MLRLAENTKTCIVSFSSKNTKNGTSTGSATSQICRRSWTNRFSENARLSSKRSAFGRPPNNTFSTSILEFLKGEREREGKGRGRDNDVFWGGFFNHEFSVATSKMLRAQMPDIMSTEVLIDLSLAAIPSCVNRIATHTE